MNLKDFISDALSNPADLIGYEVSRMLQQNFTDRAVMEGAISSFDLPGYVRAGYCSVVSETCVFNKSRMELSESGKALVEQPENAWLNVFWRGNLIDVLFLTWTEEGYRERHHWIIAETRQIAEEFLRAVCDWAQKYRARFWCSRAATGTRTRNSFSQSRPRASRT